MLAQPHRQIMIAGLAVRPEALVDFSAEPLTDGAQVPLLNGGAVVQTVYSPPERPVGISPATIAATFRLHSGEAYRATLRALSRGAPIEVFFGDYLVDSWRVSSDITTRYTSRRLPIGLSGVIPASWIEAHIDEVAADLVVAAPGAGEVQISATAETGTFSTVITQDLLGAGAAWLAMTYAPIRRCAVRVTRNTSTFNAWQIDCEFLEAVA